MRGPSSDPLRAGMAGEDVAALHRDLLRLKYSIPRDELDNQIFGVGTAAAVTQFQRAHGLWATGVFDSRTAGMLSRVLHEAELPTQAIQLAAPAPAPKRSAPAPERSAAVPENAARALREEPAAQPGEEPVEESTLMPHTRSTPPGEEPTLVPRTTAPHQPPAEEPTFVPGVAAVQSRAARPIQVAVCGPSDCTATERDHAYEVGRLLAAAGVVVLCGGGTGVMAAVAAGTRSAGGLVLGILPGGRDSAGSPHLSAVVATNLGEARNAVLAESADAMIVIGGSWGTLSELALAKRRGRIPVVCLGGWRVVDSNGAPIAGIDYVDTPRAAVAQALANKT